MDLGFILRGAVDFQFPSTQWTFQGPKRPGTMFRVKVDLESLARQGTMLD